MTMDNITAGPVKMVLLIIRGFIKAPIFFEGKGKEEKEFISVSPGEYFGYEIDNPFDRPERPYIILCVKLKHNKEIKWVGQSRKTWEDSRDDLVTIIDNPIS